MCNCIEAFEKDCDSFVLTMNEKAKFFAVFVVVFLFDMQLHRRCISIPRVMYAISVVVNK